MFAVPAHKSGTAGQIVNPVPRQGSETGVKRVGSIVWCASEGVIESKQQLCIKGTITYISRTGSGFCRVAYEGETYEAPEQAHGWTLEHCYLSQAEAEEEGHKIVQQLRQEELDRHLARWLFLNQTQFLRVAEPKDDEDAFDDEGREHV